MNGVTLNKLMEKNDISLEDMQLDFYVKLKMVLDEVKVITWNEAIEAAASKSDKKSILKHKKQIL